MERIKKSLQVVGAAVIVLFAGVSVVKALYPDAEIAAGLINIINGTNVPWKIGVNSSGHLDIIENTNLNAAVLRVNATDGSLLLRARTSAQLQALAPVAANEIIVNSSVPALCISSGTGAGAWIMIRSTNTASKFDPSNALSCY